MGVEPAAVDIVDLGPKWGSANAGRRVRNHWAAPQLSPPLVDYAVADELAHLSEAHHGSIFRQLLGRVMPAYDERKRQLAQVGARLWFGDMS